MKYELIEVGNWYSEYQCSNCDAKKVINDDADKRINDCKACWNCGEENEDCKKLHTFTS